MSPAPKQVDAVSGACQGNVEEAAFLGVGVPFRLRQDQAEKRVVRAFRGEAACFQPQEDDVVGLEPLRTVYGLERNLQSAGIAIRPFGQLGGFQTSVASEEEDGSGIDYVLCDFADFGAEAPT